MFHIMSGKMACPTVKVGQNLGMRGIIPEQANETSFRCYHLVQNIGTIV